MKSHIKLLLPNQTHNLPTLSPRHIHSPTTQAKSTPKRCQTKLKKATKESATQAEKA
jgi:hypothetical protein